MRKIVSTKPETSLSGSDFSLLQHPLNGLATFIRQATLWGISLDALLNDKLKDQPENTSGVTVESKEVQTVINALQATGSLGLLVDSVGKMRSASERIQDPAQRKKYIAGHIINFSIAALDVISAITNEASILLDSEEHADTISTLKSMTTKAVLTSVLFFTAKMAHNAYRDVYSECRPESIKKTDKRSHFRRRIDAAASSLFTGYDATVAFTLVGAFTAPEAIIPLLITDVVAQSLNVSSIKVVQNGLTATGRNIKSGVKTAWAYTVGRCLKKPVLPDGKKGSIPAA